MCVCACVRAYMRACVCVHGGGLCVNVVNYTVFFLTNGVVFDISTRCLLRRPVD